MSVNAAIHFSDPFAARGSTLHREPHHHLPRASWTSRPTNDDFNRPLTPPPDMNGVSHASNPGTYHQELGRHYNDYASSQASHRGPTARYPQYDHSGMSGYAAGTRSHTLSPVPQLQQSRQTGSAVPLEAASHSRRPSHNSAIAPSFQIPRSVNSSGGSLSELAAQVRLAQLL